jgi:small-conductance mechanosensitive channel
MKLGKLTIEEYIVSVIIFAAFFCTFLLFRIFIYFIQKQAKKTEGKIDDVLCESLKGPGSLFILLMGIHLSLLPLPLLKPFLSFLNKAFSLLYTLTGIYLILKLVNVFIFLYKSSVTKRKGVAPDESFLNLTRKIIIIAIWIVAFLVTLDQMGVKITPLLTSLGIGGLAIGLALQDTFANFFAGIYLSADRPIKVGDYIKLDSGEEGFVEEVGWRTTKIRQLSNNIIVIPNSIISQSKIINFNMPQNQMSVIVSVGVGYDSNLESVEKVTIEVAQEVMQRIPGTVKDFKPFIRYHTFADSNIEFSVILRAKTFVNQYLLKHEFIKALHKRYNEEHIEIAYPIRSLTFRDDLTFKKEIEDG